MINRRTLSLAAIALCLLQPWSVYAATSTEQLILKDIKSAQRQLSETQKTVSRERRKLSDQLLALEKDVLQLQQKTTVARRLSDEKNLSLSQLEARLDSWHQQQTYQHNLLTRFLRQQGVNDNRSLAEQIDVAVEVAGALKHQFYPSWTDNQVILDNGELHNLPTFSLGPITWYWQDAQQIAGLTHVTASGLKSSVQLTSSDSARLSTLRQTHTGNITFDPTLNKALAREQHAESVVEHVVKGGLWAIPIVLFALFALTIGVAKGIQLWRLPKIVRFSPLHIKTLLRTPNAKIPADINGMQKSLLETCQSNHSVKLRDDQLFMQLQDNKHTLERWISAIAITASVSPLLGLLGTVSGMIETFKMMTLFGSGDPEVVSGGIAQALVTTELGLVVAIPALILNAVLSRRAKSYYNELESFAVLLSQTEDDNRSSSEITTADNTQGAPA